MKRMKTLHVVALIFIFAYFLPSSLFAQVSMQIKVVQQNFLQYESVFLRLAIRNMSAHPLAFGESDTLKGKLRFEVVPMDSREHKVIKLLPDAKQPDLTGLILAPGTNRTFLFNLTSHYDIRKTGKYLVRAVISHPQLVESYQSNEDYFTVLRGTQVWSRTVGLPLLDDSKADASADSATGANTVAKNVRKIETRQYRILKYNTGTQSVYCLSIEDKNNVYFLRHIGFDLGAELKPKCEIDFLSRLNVIVAASTKVFAYYLYTPDGELEKKNILIKTDNEPFLATDIESGIVRVVGGREARKDIDYEEIRDLPFLEDMSDTEYFPEQYKSASGEMEDARYKGLNDDDGLDKKITLTEDDLDSFGASVLAEEKKSDKNTSSVSDKNASGKVSTVKPADTKTVDGKTTEAKSADTVKPATTSSVKPATTAPVKNQTPVTSYEDSEIDSIFSDL